jgi:hypothetical protein
MKTLFGGVYARPSTVGTLLREFAFGHARLTVFADDHRFGDFIVGFRGGAEAFIGDK